MSRTAAGGSPSKYESENSNPGPRKLQRAPTWDRPGIPRRNRPERERPHGRRGRGGPRRPISGMRLGVKRGTQTRSSEWAPASYWSAGTGDGEKLVGRHLEKISRRKAIGGRQDVGLPPANELFADIDEQTAFPSVALA